ncbi:hypothetical protein GGI64_002132 [Rhizobium leguminosarum]|uniref:Lipoprotein n=1 Tax=Rhizobium leguminosarum TaxID=384 RepID=A0A7Z0DX87_RHILE|nr:hypothetical protein [Rhizobium leguminosarum]NYJ11081.1 hypothetical protein [Rhizobium leguminosarum]
MVALRFLRENHISISVMSVILALSGCVTNSNGVQVSADQSRALSGERTKMGQSYNLNVDCTVATMAKIRLVQAPAHGTVDFVTENIYSNYKDSPRVKCNSRKAPGVSEYYTSKSGYSGTDMYKVRVSYGEGTIKDVTVNIKVIKN